MASVKSVDVTGPAVSSARLAEITREDELRSNIRKLLGEETRSAPKIKSIHRAQKVANRIRQYQNYIDRDFLLKELSEVDVFMFLSEIVGSVSESLATTKSKEPLGLIEIYAQLGAMYPSFRSELMTSVEGSMKTLFQPFAPIQGVTPPTVYCAVNQKESNALVPKLKNFARYMAEFDLCGVCKTQPLFDQLLTLLLTAPGLHKFLKAGLSKQASANPSTAATNSSSVLPTAPMGSLFEHYITWPETSYLPVLEFLTKKLGIQIFGAKCFRLADADAATAVGSAGDANFPQDCSLEVTFPAEFQTSNLAKLRQYVTEKAVFMFLAAQEVFLEGELVAQQMRLQSGSLDTEMDHKVAASVAFVERTTSHLSLILSLFNMPALSPGPLVRQLLQNVETSKSEDDAPIPSDAPPVKVMYPAEIIPALTPVQWASLFPMSAARYADTNVTRLTRSKSGKVKGIMSPEASLLSREALEFEVKWVDATERAFYEVVPDLSASIPAALLRKPAVDKADSAENETDAPSQPALKVAETGAETSGSESTGAELKSGAKISSEETSGSPVATIQSLVTSPIHTYIERFSNCLETECGNIDASAMAAVDQLSTDFFLQQLNTKTNRKKLAAYLSTTRRNDLHILPSIARFCASIHPHCKDLTAALVSSALSDLDRLRAEKSPFKIESKVKACRFIGELTKVSLIPPGTTLDILNSLAEDFQSHDVVMICHLLDTCGFFLIGTRGAETRLSIILDRIKRIRTSKTIPTSASVFLEDVLVQMYRGLARVRGELTGPDWRRGVVAEDSLMKRFIEHLVFTETAINWNPDVESSQSIILKLYRKLNWEKPEVVFWLINSFLNLHHTTAVESGGNIAACLAAIASIQPFFVVSFVDCFFEQIINDSENPWASKPRRVWHMYLLKNLFRYKIVDSTVVLDHIFYFLGFGYGSTYRAGHFLTQYDLIYKLAGGPKTKTPMLELLIMLSTTPFTSLSTVPVAWTTSEVTSGFVGKCSARERRRGPKSQQHLTSNKPSDSGPTISTQLGVLLFLNFLKDERQTISENTGGWFNIRLICALLKGAWETMNLRQTMPRVLRTLAFIRYHVAWLITLSGGQLPLEMLHLLSETFKEIPNGSEYLSFDLAAASQGLADYLADELQSVKAIVEKKFPFSSQWVRSSPLSEVYLDDSETKGGAMSDGLCWGEEDEDGLIPGTQQMAELDNDGSSSASRLAQEDAEGFMSSADDLLNEEDEVEEPRGISEADLQFEKELKSIIDESLSSVRTTMGRLEVKDGLHLPHQLLKSIRKEMKSNSESIAAQRSISKIRDSDDEDEMALVDDSVQCVRFALVTKKSHAKFTVRKLETDEKSKLGIALTKASADRTEDDDGKLDDRKLMKEFVMAHVDRQIDEEFRGAVNEIQGSGIDSARIQALRRQQASTSSGGMTQSSRGGMGRGSAGGRRGGGQGSGSFNRWKASQPDKSGGQWVTRRESNY